MKHFNFLSNFRWFTTVILLITLGIGQMWGEDLNSSLTYGSSVVNNDPASSDAIGTYFTATWAQTSAQAAPIYYNKSSTYGVKMYVQKNATTGNTLTISTTTSGVYITKITITGQNAQGTTALYWQGTTSNTGTSKTFTAASKTQSVAIRLKETGNSKAGQYIVKTISIDYTILTTVTLDKNGGTTNGSATIYYDATANTSFTAATRTGSYTCNGYYTATSGGNKVLNADGTFAGNVSEWITSSKWSKAANTATLYAQWESAASCSVNPTIGAASINGSFNMTSTTSSIGVSSGTCSTGNAACDWTDYGFVWSDGANTTTPTVGGTNCNKVQVGTTGNGTSWTGSITPSGSTTPTTWTTGHTYYVRTYGKNSKAGAAFVEGTAWSFTPYLVTFNKNDGGATTSTQYVQGGVSTPLTSNSFSRTGYTFNGWNTNADGTSGTGYTNGQSVSLSANLTLYAKWSAKQCTISFDIEGGTGTITNVTATYGQAMPSKESNLPTKTGYNFGGFWDGDGGTGTQYYNADGTSKINWNKDVTATQTLYAKWTVKNYSVTWKVNGEEWSGKGGTDNANYNTAWSSLTLPTAPDPDDDGCGQKFVGWTTTENYSNATTAPTDLLNADNKSGKTAVKITDNVVFHAVFADYDE